jgi:hypothetical protein
LIKEPSGIVGSKYVLTSGDPHFRRLFAAALVRPPPDVPKVKTLKSVSLSRRPTKWTVGLTRYSRVRFFLLSRPRQTITFYSSLLDELSDPAALAIMGHELAHAWLNEHVEPIESVEREKEADELARKWGFGPELDALDREAETVNSG